MSLKSSKAFIPRGWVSLPRAIQGANRQKLPKGTDLPVSSCNGGQGSGRRTVLNVPSTVPGWSPPSLLCTGDLGSFHTAAHLHDLRWGLRADQWQRLLSGRIGRWFTTQHNYSHKAPMENTQWNALFKKKKKSTQLAQGHYTSKQEKGQNCLKWFSKI